MVSEWRLNCAISLQFKGLKGIWICTDHAEQKVNLDGYSAESRSDDGRIGCLDLSHSDPTAEVFQRIDEGTAAAAAQIKINNNPNHAKKKRSADLRRGLQISEFCFISFDPASSGHYTRQSVCRDWDAWLNRLSKRCRSPSWAIRLNGWLQPVWIGCTKPKPEKYLLSSRQYEAVSDASVQVLSVSLSLFRSRFSWRLGPI